MTCHLAARLLPKTAAHLILLAAMAVSLQGQQQASDPLVGSWQGTLDVGAVELEVAMHITAKDGGEYSATFDSISQGANDIPVTSLSKDGNQFTAKLSSIGSSFTGKLVGKGDDRKLVGTWSQGGAKLPLTMASVAKVKVSARPQQPKAPFPYEVVEVQFDSVKGVKLAGTLTLPRGPGPHPVAVMITGSGPQDRDETVLRHKPFMVIADHLTRRGLAVLRYDDRGVGESTGDFATATSADFADDVRAAMRFLMTRADVDHKRIGLIGHSEGGIIAPMVASGPEAEHVAFSILIAPPSVNIRDVMLHQSRLISGASGSSDYDLDVNEAMMREVFAAIAEHQDAGDRHAAVKKVAEAAWPKFSAAERESAGDNPDALVQSVSRLEGPWMRYLLGHDPVPALRQMHGQVLVLFGGQDLQVDPAQNLPPLKNAFAGRKPAPTIVTLANHNHLFQRCETGSTSEYGTIEETFSPKALAAIASWVERVVLTR